MRRREFFRRWDAHMGRMDAYTERGDVLMADIRLEMELTRHEVELTRHVVELTRKEVELSRTSRDDLRSFIREINVRMTRHTDAVVAELRGLREESRAQRQALLRMIDRMDGLEPGGGSAG